MILGVKPVADEKGPNDHENVWVILKRLTKLRDNGWPVWTWTGHTFSADRVYRFPRIVKRHAFLESG